jgi:hypothetical protein
MRWFDTQKSRGLPLTSPLTNLPLSSENLTENSSLKYELDIFKASTSSSIQNTDIKFSLSSDIFKELDRISSLPQLNFLHLQPPKIVVIGNESHGKSTLLERIIGLPIFPKDKQLCTRCIVRVHLRRNPNPSIAEISLKYNTPNNNGFVDGFPKPFIAALDNIREKISFLMNELTAKDERKRLIFDDIEIIVNINLPYCLNIDILDVPGLVTTSPVGSTQSLPEITHALALKVIKEHKDSSIFLLVNDVRIPPNQSRGCAIIEETKIQNQTLGVFTKMDIFISEDGDEVNDLHQLLTNEARNSFPVGYGWLAIASKKPFPFVMSPAVQSPELYILQTMDNFERMSFQQKYKKLISSNLLGIDNVRQRIQGLYEVFIKTHWIPTILSKLESYSQKLEKENCQLGYPLPRDPEYCRFSSSTTFSPIVLQDLLSVLFSRCEKECETAWVKLSPDQEFWSLLSNYHGLFDFRKPFEYYRNGGLGNGTSYYNQKKITFKSEILQFVTEAHEASASKEKLENAMKSTLNSVCFKLRSKLENSDDNINGILNTIFDYTTKPCEVNGTTYEFFNLARFPALKLSLKRIVSSRLDRSLKLFDKWCLTFPLQSPLTFFEYFSDQGKVCCVIQWSNPQLFDQYPHRILQKFYEILRETLLSISEEFTTEDLLTVEESCRKDRLRILKEKKEVIEVKKAVELFAERVEKQLNSISSK